jgi:flavorubredoxin
MHLASSARFADEIEDWILKDEGEKYYANILMPYSHLVTKLLDKVTKTGMELAMILPDHGPLWRRKADIQKVLNFYSRWAEQKPGKKALILYDTMWHSTEKMAHMIAEGIIREHMDVKLMSLKLNHRSDIAQELLDCGALLIGSPTLNNSMLPTVADTLTYLNGLKRKNLIGAVFGSFGWSGEAVKQMEQILTDMGVILVSDGISVQYRPDANTLQRCFEVGKQVAQILQEL